MKTIDFNLAVNNVPENLTDENVLEILNTALEMGFAYMDEKGINTPLWSGNFVATSAS